MSAHRVIVWARWVLAGLGVAGLGVLPWFARDVLKVLDWAVR